MHRRRKQRPAATVRWAAGVTLVAAACVGREPTIATDTSAIIGGTADTGDPGVVALQGSSFLCTGVVISPRVVLTAGHCLMFWRRFPMTVTFGSSAASPDSSIPIVDAIRQPEFTIEPSLHRDIGMALLATPTSVPPSPLWRTPLDAAVVGGQLRLVGYGAAGIGAPSDLMKRQGTTVVDSYDGDTIAYSMMPNTTCLGDSGGPAFMKDATLTEQVVAITSGGDTGCTHGWSTRVDLQADTFIDPYVADVEPGAAGPGDRCYYEGQCATGTCAASSDEPALSYCSDPCATTQDCRPGMECSSQMCRWPLPTPGALGTACESDHECASDVCGSPALGEPPRCAQGCILDRAAGETCPSGSSCVDDVRRADRSMCVRSSSGCGCGATHSSDGVVVALGALALRRRRRTR
jgi:hypothetical protein